MNKEIKIPEGYEVRIEGNKVILEPKESEDEKMRRAILAAIRQGLDTEMALAIYNVTYDDVVI